MNYPSDAVKSGGAKVIGPGPSEPDPASAFRELDFREIGVWSAGAFEIHQ